VLVVAVRGVSDLLICAPFADDEKGAMTKVPARIEAATVQLRKGRLANCILKSLPG